MKFISPQMEDDECTDVETNNLLGDKSTQEKLIDEIIDDLTFMADTIGIETAMSLEDNYLTVYQEEISKHRIAQRRHFGLMLCDFFFTSRNAGLHSRLLCSASHPLG